MALNTIQLTDRVVAIEEKLNEIQTALNNLATRAQLKQTLYIRQDEIDELQAELTSVKSQLDILQGEEIGGHDHNSDYASVIHTHVEGEITDLQDYAVSGHAHLESDITDLQNYALSSHDHDLDYAAVVHGHTESDISDLQNYALSGHNHNSDYSALVHTHTESEITDLQNYALSGHNHDADYSASDHDHIEPFQSPISTSGVAVATVDFSTGRLQILDLEGATGDVTLTISGAQSGGMYGLRILQGSVDRDIIWPGTVQWPGGTVPTITLGNDSLDFFQFLSDGTNLTGMFVQDIQ